VDGLRLALPDEDGDTDADADEDGERDALSTDATFKLATIRAL